MSEVPPNKALQLTCQRVWIFRQGRLHVAQQFVEALHRVGHLFVKLFQRFHADGQLLIAESNRRADHAGSRVHAFVELLGPKPGKISYFDALQLH